MFSNDADFLAHANATLEHWADSLDQILGDRWDVEFSDGILTITLPDRRQYVINRHLGNRQIWLSSPLSGAARFDVTPQGDWMSTRQPDLFLHHLLENEVRTLSGEAIALSSVTLPL